MGLGGKKNSHTFTQTYWVIQLQISYSKGNNCPETSKTLGNLFFNQAAYATGDTILIPWS